MRAARLGRQEEYLQFFPKSGRPDNERHVSSILEQCFPLMFGSLPEGISLLAVRNTVWSAETSPKPLEDASLQTASL